MVIEVTHRDVIAQNLEEDRRRRLLNYLLPTGLILIGLAILGGLPTVLQPHPPPETAISLAISALLMVSLASSWLLLRRERLRAATNLFLSVTTLAVLALVAVLCLATPFSDQSLIQLACLSIVITLASAVGDLITVIVATILESIFIITILSFVHTGTLSDISVPHRLLLIFGILTYHWAIALLLITGMRALHSSLRVLGQTTERLSQAQQVDELKDAFITQVNHELRTPIMSLQGYVDLIADLDADLSPEDRRLMLKKAQAAGENLIRFVNDVLDTRRIEQDQEIDHTFTPLRPLVADALLVIPPQEQRLLRIDVPSHLAVWGDPERLLQVMANLLSNALKYSPSGSPIEIAARQAGQTVEISVRDYGLGVPPDQAAALFHRFVRLERDLRSRVRGTGVGLFLCRTYVEAMGGSIMVESQGIPGEGSRFVVRLPAFEGEVVTPGLTPTRKLRGGV